MATSPSTQPDEPQALPSAPAPRVRVRVPPLPSLRVPHATPFEQFFDNIRSTVLSEETLVLMEFLIVITIGIVAFFTAFPTFSTAVDSVASYINKQFGTTF